MSEVIKDVLKNHVYLHKKNKKLYQVLDIGSSQIKQTSNNEWENCVRYMSMDDYKDYCTGISRFKKSFSEVTFANSPSRENERDKTTKENENTTVGR